MDTEQQELAEKALELKQQAPAPCGGEQVTTTWSGIQAVKGGSWRDRETITIEEAAKILKIGRNSAYAAAHNGDLPGMWIGKRFLVSVPRLKRMLDGEAA